LEYKSAKAFSQRHLSLWAGGFSAAGADGKAATAEDQRQRRD